jgi:hypothetical protein
MALVHKALVDKTLVDFDRYCQELRDEIKGKEIPPEEAPKWIGPDRYDALKHPVLVHINPDRIEDAVEHLKATFLALKRLKSKSVK